MRPTHVPWFRSKDWPAWQRMLGDTLPASWDDWNARARQALDQGVHARFLLVTVVPTDFQKWCRDQGHLLSIDALEHHAATKWQAQHEGGSALTWQISPAEQLVVADVVERVGPTDFHDFIKALVREGVMHYRRLVDLSLAPGLVRASSITTVAKTLAAVRRTTPLGPAAFVVESDLARQLTEMLIEQANDRQRMRIFDHRFAAFEWLKSRPVPRPRKKPGTSMGDAS